MESIEGETNEDYFAENYETAAVLEVRWCIMQCRPVTRGGSSGSEEPPILVSFSLALSFNFILMYVF